MHWRTGPPVHWAGAKGPHAGNARSDAAGGGHAHAGLLIYQGDSWPEEYRGKIFMNNIHGQRINMDVPRREGSGYVASHGPDFLLANDAWARFINLRYGPDGNVFWQGNPAAIEGRKSEMQELRALLEQQLSKTAR